MSKTGFSVCESPSAISMDMLKMFRSQASRSCFHGDTGMHFTLSGYKELEWPSEKPFRVKLTTRIVTDVHVG